VVDTPLLDISSTEIRRRIASEPDYNGEGLPPVVWEEIKEKNLYR
jgi:nicotinic acid mononucleotide adenylyltransferase